VIERHTLLFTQESAPFRSRWKILAITNSKGSPVICRSGTWSDPTISPIALAIMITGFGLPSEEGSGMPNHSRGLLLPAKAISGLSRVRTELGHLRVIPSVAPHPEQANG
jgi:hypothetical protein